METRLRYKRPSRCCPHFRKKYQIKKATPATALVRKRAINIGLSLRPFITISPINIDLNPYIRLTDKVHYLLKASIGPLDI